MTASSLNVLVILPLSDAQRARLEAGAPSARYTYVPAKPGAMLGEPSAEQVAGADVIVGIAAENLAHLTAGEPIRNEVRH